MANIGVLKGRLELDARGFKKQVQDAQKTLKSAGRSMQRVGRNMSLRVTAPILAAGGAAFKASKDFDRSLNEMVALVGVSREQVNKWSQEIRQLGPELGKTPQELADAMFFVTSAGLEGAEAMEVLRISAKASAAGLGRTKTVADLVTSAMNAYGSETLSATQATDTLVGAVREGKAEPADLAASMGQVLPIASEMGVRFDEAAAAIAGMTRTGTKARTASRQLRQILSSLLNPSREAADTLNQMGLSASDLREKLRGEGLLRVLQMLTERFEGNDEAAGKVFGNIRALSGVMDLMGSNAAENAQIFAELANAAGSTETAFEETNDAQRRWNQTVASAHIAAVDFGLVLSDSILPALEGVTGALNSASEAMRGMDDTTRTVVTATLATTAAIFPLMIVLGAFVNAVSTLLPLLRPLAPLLAPLVLKAKGAAASMTLLSKAAGFLARALSAVLGPIGLTTAGIGALLLGVVRGREEAMRFHEEVRGRGSESLREYTTALEMAAIKQREAGDMAEVNDGLWRKVTKALGGTTRELGLFADASSVAEQGVRELNQALRDNVAAQMAVADATDKSLNQILRDNRAAADNFTRSNQSLAAQLEIVNDKISAQRAAVVSAAEEFGVGSAQYESARKELDRLLGVQRDIEFAMNGATKATQDFNSALSDVGDTSADIPEVAVSDAGIRAIISSLESARAGGMKQQERFALSLFEQAQNIPQFAQGGIVPGPTGSPQLIMAHGGEEVVPRGGKRVVEHTGTIRVEGVNDQGELVGVVEQTISESFKDGSDRQSSRPASSRRFQA